MAVRQRRIESWEDAVQKGYMEDQSRESTWDRGEVFEVLILKKRCLWTVAFDLFPHPHSSGSADEEKELWSISEPLPVCRGNKQSCHPASSFPFHPRGRENRIIMPGKHPSYMHGREQGSDSDPYSFLPVYTRKTEQHTTDTPLPA